MFSGIPTREEEDHNRSQHQQGRGQRHQPGVSGWSEKNQASGAKDHP